MDVMIPAVKRLPSVARAKDVPVVFTTTAYAVTEGPNTDMGLSHHKIPVEVLQLGTDAVAIPERIAPEPGERVIVKKRASAFGVAMASCVRHTVEDVVAEGFRPIVVRECIGDRVAGAVEWNLFEIDAKFGDVEPLDRVLEYLEARGSEHHARTVAATGD